MKKTILIFTIVIPLCLNAQDKDSVSVMKIMEEELIKPTGTSFTAATFKTTRLINAHSVENLGRGVLDVKISHRFGTLNTGAYEMFGLDNATIRIGGDYGITDWLMVGVGRSSFEKQFDAFLKARILRQSTGEKNFPFTLSGVAAAYAPTVKITDPNVPDDFVSRLSYVYQLLLARKFTEGLSIQVSPTLVHYNVVEKASDKNNIIAIGIGGRQKITKRVSINIEYYYQIPEFKLEGMENALSVGFDIETGGHVFQLIFTNSTGIAENQYIAKTSGKWGDGDIHFGFNISRVFTIAHKKKK